MPSFLSLHFMHDNSGFNCTYDEVTGYSQCYDGSDIDDPYEAFPSDPNNRPVGGSTNIAYMLTISKCPEDVTSLTNPTIDNNIYYDTYAICRHAICGISTSSEELILGAPPNTKYDYTMYAAIHPGKCLDVFISFLAILCVSLEVYISKQMCPNE